MGFGGPVDCFVFSGLLGAELVLFMSAANSALMKGFLEERSGPEPWRAAMKAFVVRVAMSALANSDLIAFFSSSSVGRVWGGAEVTGTDFLGDLEGDLDGVFLGDDDDEATFAGDDIRDD